MTKKLCLSALSLIIGCYAVAQSIVVNPDGTHSIMVTTGNASTIINSNGSPATVINNGSTSVIVNPDGTHSTAFNNGNTSIVVGPTGMHSIIFHNQSTVRQIGNENSRELEPIFVKRRENRIGKRIKDVKKAEKRKRKGSY
jgi:hypothetical protein